jgi:hypothetical protein
MPGTAIGCNYGAREGGCKAGVAGRCDGCQRPTTSALSRLASAHLAYGYRTKEGVEVVDVGVDPGLAAWRIDESAFPRSAGITAQIEFLLRYAILAPSGHNTQPWLFRVREGHIDLRADRSRALPVVDPDDRELVISCGAALQTFQIAARHFGLDYGVELDPEPGDNDLLARIRLEPGNMPAAADRELFAAISRRRTNRLAYADRDVSDMVIEQVVNDAACFGVWLHPVDRADHRSIAELVARGDRIQMADKSFRRELASWLHPNRSRSLDGIRGYGFGFNDLLSTAVSPIVRSFDLGKRQAARDRAHAEHAARLVVLGTDRDEPAHWLAAGQALQRILLRCCAVGVSAAFLNQPIEVAELRPLLAHAIGREGAPQLLLRLGYGPSVEPQPRLPVADVLVR